MILPKLINDYYLVEIQKEDGVDYRICKSKNITKSLIDVDTKEELINSEVLRVTNINEYRLLLAALAFKKDIEPSVSEELKEVKEEPKHEKELLYYDSYSMKHKHIDGCPIVDFNFINVRDDSKVTLMSCGEEMRFDDGTIIYDSILDASRDYDILWKIEDNTIKPIHNNYNYVKLTYFDLLSKGVKDYEMNEKMLNELGGEKYIKVLKP